MALKILHHTTFDEGFVAYPGEEHLLVPRGFHPVWTPGDKPGPVRPEVQPEIRSRGDRGMRTGENGLKLAHAWAFFDGALYMQFASAAGRRYAAQAYATAESGGGLACRVGVDPTGGTDHKSSAVVWSDWWGTDNTEFKSYLWKKLTAEAVATGDQVTVFLRVACRDPVQVNAGFFDDLTFSGEEYNPPPVGGIEERVIAIETACAKLRDHIETSKRLCLIV